MNNQKKLSICIVEDNVELLENLAPLIEMLDDMSLAGAYTSAEEALDQVDWFGVDILLADIDLPGMTGVELIRVACTKNPELMPLAYTVYEDRETVFGALEAGAYGYILKGMNFDELVDSIRQLASGGAPMSAAVARKVIGSFRERSDIQDCEPLSIREKSLLALVADGLGYKEIAAHLNISPHTVHAHVRNIYAKLHVSNRHEALSVATKLGYLVKPGA
ncbi:MAG: response regulator transcription factor [Kiritimatiellae bacterium]|nr:response regulator transcription factor [Kiritimatiellia bacterium]